MKWPFSAPPVFLPSEDLHNTVLPLSPIPVLHMFASTCDSLLCASQGLHFHGGGTERCFFGSRGSGLLPGSPYPIQLGFVIGSPGLKDTVHHLTLRNACKMSNQRRVWSSRPPRQASFLQAVAAGPGRPLSLMISPYPTPPPVHQIQSSRLHWCRGGEHARMWWPTVHQTR